ncbi:hypothetical protein Syn7502_02864 [Synechococcus sp. PCC 7502]|uniref:hypothetical protein n=1 Tax=Synechococcus sp. PCC 7502 TaxID=1173263 RepID=UPI00029FCF0C|nr:hypothetical protein [Synechococcus sp. PCC 7502]AFY74800.1 hypothetical protein Syn7502_02864 [Synechococcus sp. PCC 7502]
MNNQQLLALGFELPEQQEIAKRYQPSRIGKWLATAWVILPIVASGFGIGSTVANMQKAIAQESTPPVVEVEPEIVTPRTSDPRLLKLTVNVSSPEDLKVKQGDEVKKEQVVADRDKERDRLTVQKVALTNSIARLNIASIPPLAPKPVKVPIKLPSITYAEEIATINNQILKVKAAEEKVKLQQRKIDVLGTFDERDLPQAVLIHEQQKLIEYQADLDKAKSDQELAEGKYQAAKDRRAYDEYRYSETIAKFEQDQNQIAAQYQRSLAEYQKQEQERTFQIATLNGKMAEVETQLKTLTTVRSPYNAVVKRIKLAGQSDNKLQYDLVLAINSGSDRPTKTSPKK